MPHHCPAVLIIFLRSAVRSIVTVLSFHCLWE
jgi:hypothetical protein